jgi:hypothetical protein
MDGSAEPRVSKGMRVRWTARVIMILWALFWLFFAVADGMGDLAKLGPAGKTPLIAFVVVVIVCLLIAWFAELIGGLLLIAVGLVAYFFFHVPTQFAEGNSGIFVLLVMVLPPLLAGVLLEVNLWVVHKAKLVPPKPAA